MPTPIPFIPAWRSDESLYSWVAGYHSIFGNGSARDTGALLFGSEHACRERDAPTNLHHFVEVTHGELGDVGSILLTRSPIGLFVPFLQASRQQVLADRIGKVDGNGWRLLCGMPASGLGDRTVLQYCEACVAEDLKTWGYPRWRLPHQLMGAWVCLDHGLVLQALKTNASQWLLPPITIQYPRLPTPDRPQVESLRRMAKLAQCIIDSKPLEVSDIRQAVLTGLRDYGITNWTHPLDNIQLASWFTETPIATWLSSSSGPWQRLASGHWVHDLLRTRRGDHPLKWMLLWSALFVDEIEEASHRRFLDPGSQPHWDASGQGAIWGASGFAVPSDIQRVITEAPTLKEAARNLGLTVFSLRRRLSDLGTNARHFRLIASYEKRRDRAINAIRSYIVERPTCSRNDVHRNCKSALAWIRENDPDLFTEVMQPIEDRQPRQLSLQFMASEFSQNVGSGSNIARI